MNTGAKFWQSLKDFRDDKRFQVSSMQQENEEEGPSPETDCSLKQCCQDMVDQNLLSAANARACK